MISPTPRTSLGFTYQSLGSYPCPAVPPWIQCQFKLEFLVQKHKCDCFLIGIMEVARHPASPLALHFHCCVSMKQGGPALLLGLAVPLRSLWFASLEEHAAGRGGSWLSILGTERYAGSVQILRVLILLTPLPPPGSWEPGNCWVEGEKADLFIVQ